jgi:hypothetical protein
MTTTAVPEFTIVKAATDPVPAPRPRNLRPSDHIVLDPRGLEDTFTACLFDASCVDCGEIVTINPLGLEPNEDGIFEVVALCQEHNTLRQTWAAIDIQQAAEMAKRRARTEQVVVAVEPVAPRTPARSRKGGFVVKAKVSA